MWAEREIQQTAAQQHGVITRAQLIAAGVTDHEITRRLIGGRMQARFDGVYYLDSVPITWATEIRAALFACGPAAIKSHRCAAVLWGLDGVYGRMAEVTVPYDDSPEPDGVIVHRTRRHNPATAVLSLPTTSIEKTILDLAGSLPERVLVKAARSAVRRGLTTPPRLDRAIGVFCGRGVAGTRRARRVVGLVAEDQSGSVAEIDLMQLVVDAPIPRPVQQLRVRLPDSSNAYPDFAWLDRMRIVGADGFEAHGTPDQLEQDLWRQNQLMDLGWEIRRFTATTIRERPKEVQDEIIRFINKPFCER